MNTEQITPELYEQVKAMVLEEIEATKKAKAEARKAARIESKEQAKKLFDPLRRKYTPLLVRKLRNSMPNGRSLEDRVEHEFWQVTRLALRTIGEFDEKSAYQNNKSEEANRVAGEILDAMLNN